MRGVECLPRRARGYFKVTSAAALCRYRASRQRMVLGWQAKPTLEHVGEAPLAPRVQLMQSSVHRVQFGGPACIETLDALGVARGGMASSVAVTALHPAIRMVSARASRATTL